MSFCGVIVLGVHTGWASLLQMDSQLPIFLQGETKVCPRFNESLQGSLSLPGSVWILLQG